MLKELWRKLGAEFLQISGSEAPTRPGGQESGSSAEFRILPHITHTGEFHLERLTSVLQSRYGKTFQASDQGKDGNGDASDQAIRELISYAARIQDQDIQRELLLFYLNCSPMIQEYLRSETVLGEGHFLSR